MEERAVSREGCGEWRGLRGWRGEENMKRFVSAEKSYINAVQ